MIGLLKQALDAVHKRVSPETHARSIGVRLGLGCRLINCDYSSEPYLITLGDRVSATKVRFETHDGGIWVFRAEHPEIDVVRPITIGSNVFIGYESVIMPGVTIGNNVVIGARSIVTRDIPAGSVAVGVPARVLKTVGEYKSASLTKAEMTKSMPQAEKRRFYLKKFGKAGNRGGTERDSI
jgi:hypothetical protein